MNSEGFFTNPQTNYQEAFTIETGTFGELKHQADAIGQINNKYDDISGAIVEQQALYDQLMQGISGEYIDFSGTYLDYKDRKSHVKDAVKEDIHMMILQQNNAYIIGMITITTVLIATYLVTKK
jgi:hypothetical protein